MANYEALARSNYFRVKDPEAFRQWCKDLGLEVITKKEEALFGWMNTDGGIPSQRDNDQAEEEEDLDFFAELATHLHPGEVAVAHEIGHEKMRCLDAVAVAINSEGVSVQLSLDEIYEQAQALRADPTTQITTATY